jgi:hypothetical protein
MVYRDFNIATSEQLEPVGQLRMPARFTLHLRDDDEGGPNLDLTWQVRNGAPECTDVNITAAEKGHEIRVTGLRGIRVEDCLERTVRWMMSTRTDGSDEPQLPEKTHWFDFATGREAVRQTRAARAGRRVKITDNFLREVAEVYRANVADRPTQSVAEYFDRGHSAAALYVKRARAAGFLGPTTKGKAGER